MISAGIVECVMRVSWQGVSRVPGAESAGAILCRCETEADQLSRQLLSNVNSNHIQYIMIMKIHSSKSRTQIHVFQNIHNYREYITVEKGSLLLIPCIYHIIM